MTGGSAETYKIVIAYPEKKIHTIKHTDVFCVDKAGFLRLGNKFYAKFSSYAPNSVMSQTRIRLLESNHD